jgi:plasmid stabilization system protein ParE
VGERGEDARLLETLRRSMKFRYSRRATNDLATIHEYLNARNPRGALNVMTAIYAAVEFIRRHPNAAELTRIPGVRGRTVRISIA